MKDRVAKELVIGKILGAHGIKGGLRVYPYTEDPENFKELGEVKIKNKMYPIIESRLNKGKVILILEGVNNRNKAEALKGENITIPRELAAEPEEDEFFIVDLLGCDVLDKSGTQKIGEIEDIIQTSGEVNNFLINTGEKKIYVPALKEYFSIDIEKRTILSDIPEEFYKL